MNIKLDFYKCIQDSQHLGSDTDHMVSRVFFHLTAAGHTYDLWSNVRQAAGEDYLEDPTIEVEHPQGSTTPIALNYMAFHDAVERYYQKIIGPGNTMISVGPGVKDLRMYGNVYNIPYSEEFELNESCPAW